MKTLDTFGKICINILLAMALIPVSWFAWFLLTIVWSIGGIILPITFGLLIVLLWAYVCLYIVGRMCGFHKESQTATRDTVELNSDDVLSCITGDYIANGIVKGGK